MIRYPWEIHILALEQFKAREGHINVPAVHIENYFSMKVKLGDFIYNCRISYYGDSKIKLTESRKLQLNNLGMVWTKYRKDIKYIANINAIKSFKTRYGHVRIPIKHVEKVNGIDINIGKFIHNCRTAYNGTGTYDLSQDKIDELNELGMVWVVRRKKEETHNEDKKIYDNTRNNRRIQS